jgi:sugar lactone lactonase YvrE
MSVPVPEALRTRVAGVPGLGNDLQDLAKEATTLAEIGRLAKAGNKIAAIKLYRAQFRVGLKEAKDAVDLIEQGRLAQVTASATAPTVMDIRQSSGSLAVLTEPNKPQGAGRVSIALALVAVVLLVIGVIVFAMLGSFTTEMRDDKPQLVIGQDRSRATASAEPARAPTAQPSPTPAPTPAFATAALTFGGEGMGPGKFTDGRSIAVDGSDRIYVGEYTGGRVQVFDATGKFLTQWFAGNADTLLLGFAVDREGTVYVADGHNISRFHGPSGKPLGKLWYDGGPRFAELATTPNGGLVAFWYERREGIFTSREGAREDMVRFDAQGDVVGVTSAPISSQTEQVELDNYPAVDGRGNIYVLGTYSSAVFKFTSEGKFVNRFGNRGNEPGQFNSNDAIALDSQGQVYVADGQRIHIFGSDGHYLRTFEVESSPSGMAFNDKDELFILSRGKVIKYVLAGAPASDRSS